MSVMAVATLRQIRQMPHTEIEDYFKSELQGTLAQIFFASLRSAIK